MITGCKHELVTVLSRDTGEGDPPFPIVTCPHCRMRWIGHREEARAVPQDRSLFSDAARDALLSGQDRRALRLILEEHDLVPRVTRPTACLPMVADDPSIADPGQSIQIIRRPQVNMFRGTHLLIHPEDAARFNVVDLLVGNRSQLLQGRPIPGLRFACDLRGDVVMTPGERERQGLIDIEPLNHHVDLSPFAWDLEIARVTMDFVLYVTNVSSEPSPFRAWILGLAFRDERDVRSFPPLNVAELAELVGTAAV